MKLLPAVPRRETRERETGRDAKAPVADCTHVVSMQDAAVSRIYSAGTFQGKNTEIMG